MYTDREEWWFPNFCFLQCFTGTHYLYVMPLTYWDIDSDISFVTVKWTSIQIPSAQIRLRTKPIQSHNCTYIHTYINTLWEHQSWWSNLPYATANTEPVLFQERPVQWNYQEKHRSVATKWMHIYERSGQTKGVGLYNLHFFAFVNKAYPFRCKSRHQPLHGGIPLKWLLTLWVCGYTKPQ